MISYDHHKSYKANALAIEETDTHDSVIYVIPKNAPSLCSVHKH